MSKTIDISAIGMVTAVGLDAPSSCAAMRAKLDGFQETRFMGAGGNWLVGAPVQMPRNWIGEKRLAHMAAAAVTEVFATRPEARGTTDVILCLAEESRKGSLTPDPARLARRIGEIVDLDPTTKTRAIAHGRPSGFVALGTARKMIDRGDAQNVLIVGVDSYLSTRAVAHYLSDERLLVDGNANGFIPGEAAGAVLCTKQGKGSLSLTGLGLTREKASIYNADDLPLRGDGMTDAYAHAFKEGGIDMAELGYRISDLIGEQYWFKQTALASLRLLRGRHDFQDLWSPAESLGNVGAAVVPIMVGMAFTAAQKGYAAGNPTLLEASADDGACGAGLFEARAA